MKKIILGSLLTLSLGAQAAKIAVIDSGNDVNHQAIKPYVWENPFDNLNYQDDDGNGYIDDVYGWNFAENNNQVIDYSYLGTLNDNIRKFFEIQAKIIKNEASKEEISWLRTIVRDKKFIKKLSIYGNFMHGTHVSGIALRDNDEGKLISIKLIPTEVKLPSPFSEKSDDSKGLKDQAIKLGLRKLAQQQMVLLSKISNYISFHQANVANGSFGTGYKQAKMIIGRISSAMRINLSPEEIKKYSIYFLDQLILQGKSMVMSSPRTLFVFAAGNDGSDNDKFPTSPANIDSPNSISVAATLGRTKLASFSNFGKKTVDIAAPGVSILSAAPGDNYLKVSGTSQAAPYVTNVASRIMDINPSLTPKMVKKILMGTVDPKSFLKDIVKSGGVVNLERAVYAAELSKTREVDTAIQLSRESIYDSTDFGNEKSDLIDESLIFPVEMPSLIK